jgi:hypothetical protein
MFQVGATEEEEEEEKKKQKTSKFVLRDFSLYNGFAVLSFILFLGYAQVLHD